MVPQSWSGKPEMGARVCVCVCVWMGGGGAYALPLFSKTLQSLRDKSLPAPPSLPHNFSSLSSLVSLGD